MRTLLTGLLMATLVFGSSASMAAGGESDEYLGTRQALPGPSVTLQHHASTLEEGVLRGSGALLRGAGEAQYLRSLASINREYARRLYIENREKAAEAYFNLKRTNRYAREELQTPRVTAEDVARQAADRLPAVLSVQEYDREFGVVNWPAVLLREEFENDRSLIDALVSQRTNSKMLAAEIDSDIASVTDAMLSTLRVAGADLSSTEFITAMKFLKSLRYEALVNPTQFAAMNQAVVGTPAVSSVVSR
jgi:hypothetical protein